MNSFVRSRAGEKLTLGPGNAFDPASEADVNRRFIFREDRLERSLGTRKSELLETAGIMDVR